MESVVKAVEDYVSSLGLDAYLVGGAVRDELLGLESKDADFLVTGVDIRGLRALLEPHGRVDELVVAGRPVGLRLQPRDRDIRALTRAGIEFAPPRCERSTGPGRHDFEIVVDPTATVEDDLARRDFRVNAIARHLGDGTIVDPFRGREDIQRRRLRTVSPRSFAEDPLRLVRGLRLVSQLDFDPDEETLRQMREEAPSVQLVSGERIGGGLAADGMGELSRLLLGANPAKALRIARDTGVLAALVPEFAPAIGFDPRSPDHDLTLDEHVFAVVQAAAAAGVPLRVRLAALLHDLGKPLVGDGDHEELGAELARAVLIRLRYPTRLTRRVTAIVRFHPFRPGAGDALEARRLLARHGEELAFDLLDHWNADVRGRDQSARTEAKLDWLRRFRAVVEAERASPHRLADLAVDGDDLLTLGYRQGPPLGRTLAALLEAVVEQPELNRRELLLDRARERLEP
jgi:tRNA nucleotidyltransferase (CCA-adding enzyme)